MAQVVKKLDAVACSHVSSIWSRWSPKQRSKTNVTNGMGCVDRAAASADGDADTAGGALWRPQHETSWRRGCAVGGEERRLHVVATFSRGGGCELSSRASRQ